MTEAAHAESQTDRAEPVLYGRAAVGSVSDEDRSVEVIASTEDLDGHGTIVKQKWDLKRFRANPVVLYSHQSRALPIGVARDVRVEDGALRARIVFSTEELNPEAERVWKNVQAKVIRGVSVGFWPHTVTFEKQKDREVMVLDDNELWEISICPIPSNPAALAKVRAMATEVPSPSPEIRTMPQPILSLVILSALGLAEGASEAEAVARANALTADRERLLKASGESTVDAAVGTIEAGKAAVARVGELNAEIAKRDKDQEDRESAALLAQLKREGRITPAQITDFWPTASLESRKAFAKSAPKVAGASEHREAESETTTEAKVTTPDGKAWEDLKPMEKHALHRENQQLYTDLKNDFERRTAR